MNDTNSIPPTSDPQASFTRFVERFERLSPAARLRAAALILQEIEEDPDPGPDPETMRLSPEDESLLNRIKTAMLEGME